MCKIRLKDMEIMFVAVKPEEFFRNWILTCNNSTTYPLTATNKFINAEK